MTAHRLDVELVERGLARSRAHAKELVAAGSVTVNGVVARKVSAPVEPEAEILADAGIPWVGRGAVKLVGALEAFAPLGLVVTDRRCLDVGASTGGFTQVLLESGAAEVIALDVGHGQLHPAVAGDPRVRDLSGVNVRDTTPQTIGGQVDLLVADLSFISLRLVLPTMADLVVPDGDLVVLVKPQFEVGRGALGKSGVVRSATARRQALLDVARSAVDAGLSIRSVAVSPLRGGEGNTEYLLWMTRSVSPGLTWEALEKTVRDLTQEGTP